MSTNSALPGLETLNVQQALQSGPGDGFIWDFNKGATYLQTDNDQNGTVKWYLTRNADGDPARWVELEPTLKSVTDTLVHFSQKTWMTAETRGQLLEAMMPALRSTLYL